MLKIEAKKAKILVVDDEPTNIKLLRAVLALDEYENVFYTCDPVAVEKLQNEHNFHLIILDLNMPVMDGFQVLEMLNEKFNNDMPCVLVLTAQIHQEHRLHALKMGANDYVTKPFDQTEVLARVKNLISVKMTQELLVNQNKVLDFQVSVKTKELKDANEKLYESHLQVVRKLGRAAEYRDNETGEHVLRMSYISALLGKKIGMSRDEYELLLNASPMHDIGKIGIPDNILLKPGKLTLEEWEIMKTHASIGADILTSGNCELLAMAQVVAISHHEKFDGSGYPNGLAGEDIPLVGRITALADVFDALTSQRPYKKAWSLKDSLYYIREHSGSQFDPILVDLFFESIKEIVEIKDKHAEIDDVSFMCQYLEMVSSEDTTLGEYVNDNDEKL